MKLDICKVARGYAIGQFTKSGEFIDWWSGAYKTLRAAKIALTYWHKHPERWQNAW